MTKEEANNIVISELTIKRDWSLSGLDNELLDDFANILQKQVENLTIQRVVVSGACKCDIPDPFKLMPYKCFRCHGKIQISGTELVCEHCKSKNVTVGDGGLWCTDCGKLTKRAT